MLWTGRHVRGLGGRQESGDQARRAGQGSARAAGDSGVCVPSAGAAQLVLGVSAGGELGGAPLLPRSGRSVPREIPRGPTRPAGREQHGLEL